MKLTLGFLMGVLLLLGHAGTADAAAVKPSGKYAFTDNDSCEAKFTFTFKSYVTSTNPATTDNAVRTINSVANGHIGASVGTITFTPTSATGGNFSVTTTDISGGALRINNGGINVTTSSPQSFSGTYTYTANSLTLTPPPAVDDPMTFVMAYGQLPASGIPNSVHLIRKHAGGDTNNCVESIIATK